MLGANNYSFVGLQPNHAGMTSKPELRRRKRKASNKKFKLWLIVNTDLRRYHLSTGREKHKIRRQGKHNKLLHVRNLRDERMWRSGIKQNYSWKRGWQEGWGTICLVELKQNFCWTWDLRGTERGVGGRETKPSDEARRWLHRNNRSAHLSNLTKPNISANENFRGNMNMTRYLQGTRIQVHER